MLEHDPALAAARSAPVTGHTPGRRRAVLLAAGVAVLALGAGAIALALEDAGLAPDAIDYVNAHGTGTLANDMAEAAALKLAFGDRLAALPVSSTKPIHGHGLGAGNAAGDEA